MNNNGGIAAIAWSPTQRHVTEYARRLNASVYNIHYLRLQRPLLAPIKYVPQCLKTWLVLFQQRPSAVYVFISPVFAALSVYLYCWLAKVPFIMDVGAHAIISRKWAWTLPLVRFLARRASVNIVDQQEFQALFATWGANTVMLERPPYAVGRSHQHNTEKPTFTITLISTFAVDEPIEIVLEAADRLPEIQFFITGDTGLAKKDLIVKAPRNVSFPGYLRGDDYWDLLNSSSALMVLTTVPNSLLSGAVEGMALGKPLLLSKQPTLEDYFVTGAFFIDHTVDSLVQGIRIIQAEENRFLLEIKGLAKEKQARWEREFNRIWDLLGLESSSSSSS